jgi:hypothetical protein
MSEVRTVNIKLKSAAFLGDRTYPAHSVVTVPDRLAQEYIKSGRGTVTTEEPRVAIERAVASRQK